LKFVALLIWGYCRAAEEKLIVNSSAFIAFALETCSLIESEVFIMEPKPVRSQRKSTNIYEQLVDTLQMLFGKHPGYRPMNAKGVVCEGKFTPAVTARTLSAQGSSE
jgi:hypothetical protein